MTLNLADLLALCAVAQYLFFSSLVGRARGRYGVPAPAVTGHEGFERMYRVQMNTLELLVAWLPTLYASARLLPAWALVAGGVAYLVGRTLYWRAYVTAPATRSLGFALSAAPVFVLAAASLAAAALALLRG